MPSGEAKYVGRACLVCGKALMWKNRHAKTCGARCRQALCRHLRVEMAKLNTSKKRVKA